MHTRAASSYFLAAAQKPLAQTPVFADPNAPLSSLHVKFAEPAALNNEIEVFPVVIEPGVMIKRRRSGVARLACHDYLSDHASARFFRGESTGEYGEHYSETERGSSESGEDVCTS